MRTRKKKEQKTPTILKEGDTCPDCRADKLIATLTCRDDACGATFNPADGFKIVTDIPRSIEQERRKLEQIQRLYEGYFNTDQDVGVFAAEFYQAVGDILSGKQLKDLKLQFIILEEIVKGGTMGEGEFSKILKLPWTVIEEHRAEIDHIVINKEEFFAVAYNGNLLFTPEEVHTAQLRFSMFPKIERKWPIWELSADDIKELARQTQIDIEGLDMDTIVHYFKKGFMPLVDSWEDVLIEAIEQTRIDQLTHDKPGG